MTGCVQWRCSFKSPPNAFFIAPVVVVKTCVFTVGRCTMFSPMKRLGIENPFGYTSFKHKNFFVRSPTASRTSSHSSPSYRCTLRSPCARTTSTCLFSRSPRCASMTTVRLWQACSRSVE